PSDGANNVDGSGAVTAVFNQEIDPETVNDGNLYLCDDNGNIISGVFSYDAVLRRIVFQPTDALEYETTYTFAVSRNVVSAAGDTLPAEASSRFTTMAAPAIKAAVVTIAPETAAVDTTDSELLGGILGALLGTQVRVNALAAAQLAEVTVSLDNFVAETAGRTGAVTVEGLLHSEIATTSVLEIIRDELGAVDAEEGRNLVQELIAAVYVQGLGDTMLPVGNILQVPADMQSMEVRDLMALKGFSDAHLGSIQLLRAVNDALVPVLMTPIELPLALPALSDADSVLRVQVISPAKSAVMKLGDTIGASSTRLQLDLAVGRELMGEVIVGLNALLGIPGAVNQAIVHLPVYVEVGQAGAEVTALSEDGITLEGRTALTKLFIGEIPDEQFFSQTLIGADDVAPVNLVDLGYLLSVSVKGYAAGEAAPARLDFLPVNRQQVCTMQSAAGSDVHALLGTLAGNLELTITVLGVTIDASELLGPLQAPLIRTVFPTVGRLLNAAGRAFGVSTGNSDVILESVIYE
ncbi:MAG: Ig-like domain-containing protein, partial [Campylobacterales bacterium]